MSAPSTQVTLCSYRDYGTTQRSILQKQWQWPGVNASSSRHLTLQRENGSTDSETMVRIQKRRAFVIRCCRARVVIPWLMAWSSVVRRATAD
jgi:hypothetical protein